MNEITVAEIIELLQNESASIDTQFQLWITITSAAIIASFVARNHFSNYTKFFVATMYTLASITIGLRYGNDASQFVFLKNELGARGVVYPTFFDLRGPRMALYICGTVATSVFIFIRQKPDRGTAGTAME